MTGVQTCALPIFSLGASPNPNNNEFRLQQNLDIYYIKLFLQTDFLEMDK